MASNETITFPSVRPEHLLDQDQDGLVATHPSPNPVCKAEADPRADVVNDGSTDVEDDVGSSSEAAVSPDAGAGRVCRTGRAAYREALVERAWEMRRSESPSPTGCRLLVRPARGRSSRRRMRMDMEEVKACRDLGLELPRDWTYEISTADRPRSASSSPARGWLRTASRPGGDPRDVKAKLKVWAQAVAAASASRLRT